MLIGAGINKLPTAAPLIVGCDCHVLEWPFKYVVLSYSLVFDLYFHIGHRT